MKVAINGVNGRMGQALVQASLEIPGVSIGAALARAHSNALSNVLGRDVGEIAGVSELGVVAVELDKVDPRSVDVWVEFVLPEGAMQSLQWCLANRKPIVIGTTGFNNEQLHKIQSASESIPIVLAPNMSVGVNLCFDLLKRAADILGDDYDVEIIEAHHRNKKDAPSGTAIRMGEVIADALDRDLDADAIYGREGSMDVRSRKTIGFETIRAGDIVGEHTVMFAGMGERVEITHRASSRQTFAKGALQAACWLKDQKAGLYDMQDVLGLR